MVQGQSRSLFLHRPAFRAARKPWEREACSSIGTLVLVLPGFATTTTNRLRHRDRHRRDEHARDQVRRMTQAQPGESGIQLAKIVEELVDRPLQRSRFKRREPGDQLGRAESRASLSSSSVDPSPERDPGPPRTGSGFNATRCPPSDKTPHRPAPGLRRQARGRGSIPAVVLDCAPPGRCQARKTTIGPRSANQETWSPARPTCDPRTTTPPRPPPPARSPVATGGRRSRVGLLPRLLIIRGREPGPGRPRPPPRPWRRRLRTDERVVVRRIRRRRRIDPAPRGRRVDTGVHGARSRHRQADRALAGIRYAPS